MMRRLTLLSLIIFSFISFSAPVAASEFLTDYEITYDIKEEAKTFVSQRVSLTNLTKEYYAREYSLEVSSTKIENVTASDEIGPIIPRVGKDGGVSKINLTFNDKVVGLNNTFTFEISYENLEVASKVGRILEVNIPKLTESNDIRTYSVTVKVPKSFGSPLVIYPNPIQQSEDTHFRIYLFDKNSILPAGAYFSFGEWQLFAFNLKYHLKNPTAGPILTEIALPPDIKNQQRIFYESLKPEPKAIFVDMDGNYLAEYRLEANEGKDIELSGFAKVLFNKRDFNLSKRVEDIPLDLKEKYTKELRFWPVSNEIIKETVQEITKDTDSVYHKAKAIYDFVTSQLTYSSERIDQDLERLGALKALENRDKAVCMEYADLYITLARAAGVPAREVDGYAYTSNNETRPTIGDVLHAWVEVYLPDLGWVHIDPTWGSTTSGIDFFNSFDTNHLVFAIKGQDSEWPYPAGAYKLSPDQVGDIEVSFASQETISEMEKTWPENILINLAVPKVNLAGFPLRADLVVKNMSNVTVFSTKAEIAAKNLKSGDSREISLGTLPPFSEKKVSFSLGGSSFVRSLDEELKVGIVFKDFNDKTMAKEINKLVKLRPFYAVIPKGFYLTLVSGTLLCGSVWFLRARRWRH